MPRVSLAFFTTAPIFGLIGMGWGMYMGASGDHAMAPAHAHLNLLGMVLGAIMGAFYALAGDKLSGRLPWINFWLTNLGVIVLTGGLTVVLGGNETAPVIAVTAVGELLTVAGLATFFVSVMKMWKTAKA